MSTTIPFVSPDHFSAKLGRAPTQNRRQRMDGLRRFPGLSNWLADPFGAAAVLCISDSTGFSPGTQNGTAIGGAGGYIRQFDQLAQLLATAYPNIRVELDILDYVNAPNYGVLNASVAVGATSITSSVSIPSGTVIELERGTATAETVTTTGAPSGSGSNFTIPVPALTKAHSIGGTVAGPGAPGDPFTPAFETTRVLNTGTGSPGGTGAPYAALPGSSGQMLSIAKSNRNALTGSRYFFAVQIDPDASVGWVPAAAKNLLGLSSGSGSYGCWLYLDTSGNLVFRHSADGIVLKTRTSTVPVGGTVGTPLWVGVDAQVNNGAGGQTYTFYTSTDGRTWTQLGAAVTDTVTTTFNNPTGVYWTLGSISNGGSAGGNFFGKVYGVQVRKGGMHGPTTMPIWPGSWHWGPQGTSTNFAPIKGGPVLRIINASWPGRGLDEFDNPVYLPQMVPSQPYLAAVINTSHNDVVYFAGDLTNKWDRMLARIEARVSDHCTIGVTTQNATVRNDGPASNTASTRNDHKTRIGQLAAYCQRRAIPVVDTYAVFTDYVAGVASGARAKVTVRFDGTASDGSLKDIVHYTGDTQADQVGVHPFPAGAALQAAKLLEEFSA